MRRIDFFDGATSATTPTIGDVVASELVQYANDAAYEAAESGAPATGNIYYNTTDNVIRYYNGSSWISIVDESTSQTLTNKSIDGNNNTITNVDGDNVIVDAIVNLTATDAQAAFAEHQADIDDHETRITTNEGDIDDLETLSGSPGATDHGTFTGTTIPDNSTTKAALQALETQVDTNTSDVTDATSALGNVGSDMGTFTGTILTDNTSTKTNLQELSDAIEAVPAGLAFQGNWDANTNTPTLTSSTGTAGHYYNVSVAGSTNLDGITDWGVGDWAVFTDTGVWQKIDNSETVTSVNGNTGAVVLDADDISDAATTNKFATQAQLDKVDFITITQAVDLDTVESDTATNNAKVSADGSINTHSDVDTTTTSPTLNDVLQWDGSNWVPAAIATGTSSWTVTSQNSAYNASVNDFILADSNAIGAFTITLPAASGNSGERIAVKKTDSSANGVTIDGNGAETIDGAATYVLYTQNETVYLVCDGSNWRIAYNDTPLQLIESSSALIAYPLGVNVWGDLTSISLPPGTWDLTALSSINNTAVVPGANLLVGISTVAGNVSPGNQGQQWTATFNSGLSGEKNTAHVNSFGVTLTTTTTYYLKSYYTNTQTNVQIAYGISARRIK